MRPVRLEMEGFSTFHDSTLVEFDELDLVAFVGPTGSGKSSIIDAITFALYGSVARYDDVRLVAPVISQNANEAKVRLDFDVADRRYTAVRIVRRTKNGATTKEARLERHPVDDGPDAQGVPSEVVASGAKELSAAIEALLGLDFVQFTRTVVLPQGDFAEFLKDDPASRQRLLTRLLDLQMYGRMGVKARERAKAAGHRAAAITDRLERHTDATPEKLISLTAFGDQLAQFTAAATDRLDAIDALDERLVTLRAERRTLVEQLASLEAIAVPADVAEVGPALGEAKAAAAAARAELERVREARQSAASAVEQAGTPGGIQASLDAAERLEAIDAELLTIGDQLEAGEALLNESKANAARSSEAHDVAAAALVAARRSADAGEWIASLVEGEPCPVCRQNVGTIPDHDPDAELARAVEIESERRAASAEARRSVDTANGAVTTLIARRDDRRAERALAAERTRPESKLELVALLEKATAATTAQAAVATELQAVEKAADASANAVEELERVEQRQRVQFTRVRDGVAALEPPELAGEELVVEWTALARWAVEAMETRAERSETITTEGTELRARRDALVAELAVEAEPFDLDLDDLRDDLVRAKADAQMAVVRLETRLNEVGELRNEVKQIAEERDVYDLLGQQLSARGFEQWLLTEAVDDLVTRATHVLRELSNGQFSLTSDDRAFRIIDHRNADLERDVRTLSGGETFLASLALALALSDSIAELAPVDTPRLGSMFLDEGFGTLDPETLDTVATAIEELSASGRLVGIVTHIEALAERMPARYVVTKGPETSTVKRVLV